MRQVIKYVLSLVLLFFSGSQCLAQNETDNWYFGNRAALNFSTCTPTVVLGNQMIAAEGCASISDAQGNLLFYTDGIRVWNRNNLVMQNGTGLFGNASSTQSGVIVPQPGNDSLYYIFTVDEDYGNKGLCYSIVNIKRNAGLGEVIVKNVNILALAHEKITAVRHANKADIWVITRQCTSDKYFAWLVTASGVAATRVVSVSPNLIPNPVPASRGYLKPSPDGKKLAAAFEEQDYLEVADFNNQTGAVSNIAKISSRPSTLSDIFEASPYGVEFSPNSKLLYVTSSIRFRNNPNNNFYIHQYSVTAPDSVSMANSVQLVDSGGSVTNPTYYAFTAMQLAKNGKIYVVQGFDNKLGVINNPDVPGMGCNTQFDAVNLGGGFTHVGLPTFIQSYFDPNYRVYNYSYTEDCNKQLSFTLQTGFAYDSLRWNFDDPSSGGNNVSVVPNPTHTYSSNGPRNVQLYVFNRYGCINKIDTITKQIVVGNKYFSLGSDTSICVGDSLLLNATVAGATSYVWSTGAITPTIRIAVPGIYWCDVNFGGCTYRDSLTLGNKPYPVVNLGMDTTICEDNTLTLNATNLSSTYLWQDGSTLPTYLVAQKGTYNVIVNKAGCIAKDTINIDYQMKPGFTLGQDIQLCLGASYVVKPAINSSVSLQGLHYLWQDGSTNATLTVNREGTYRLDISNACGFASDEMHVIKGVCELYIPNAFTPNGNNKNDIFKAGFGDNISEFQIEVFNRYGQLVFKTNDRNKGWDGNVHGKPQQAGTYTWAVRYKTFTGGNMWQQMQGTVLLLR